MGRMRRGAVASGMALLATVGVGCDSNLRYWNVEMVSVNPTGDDGLNDFTQQNPAISADGTKVAWATRATDQLGWPPSTAVQIVVRDLTVGQTDLVSVNGPGTSGGNGDSFEHAFSPGGAKIAFTSYATDLGAPHPHAASDVYLRDLVTDTTALVSGDAPCARGLASHPVFSPDGTKIAFAAADAYIYDVTTGTTVPASPHVGGGCGAGESVPAAFSPDGTKLLFTSTDGTFGPVDTNELVDLYLYDTASGDVDLVSTNSAGTDAGNADSPNGGFSPDGTKVGFTSFSSDLGPVDSGAFANAFVRDLASGVTTLASVNGTGVGGGTGNSFFSQFSPDGGRVLMTSQANDLGVPDSARSTGVGFPEEDVYIRDLAAVTTTLVSVNAAGTDSGSARSTLSSGNGFVSSNAFVGGNRVVFVSGANDLGPLRRPVGDQIYMRDLVTGRTTLVTMNAHGAGGNGGAQNPAVATNGSAVAFATTANNFGHADSGTPGDLFANDIYIARYRGEADVSVTLGASPEPVAPGGTLTYTLHVANDGPDQADEVFVALRLPDGTTLDAIVSGGGCAPQSGAVLCELGDLASGATTDITVTATVQAPSGAQLVASALVGSDDADPDGTDNLVHHTSNVA
jgi:uncharacterized repeat protein (TIGR01451 family)